MADGQKPLEILVVDDDPSIRDMLSILIEDARGNVTTAFDGQDAIEKYDKGHYDVVFTDLSMPNGTGVDVVGHVTQTSPGTLVYVITAAEGVEQYVMLLTQLKELNPTDIIPKPFELEGFLSLIDRIKEYVSN